LPLAALAIAGVSLIVPSAASAKVFPNCKAVNKVYAHGIAMNFKVIKTANGLTGRPFVSAKQYAANSPRDGDKARWIAYLQGVDGTIQVASRNGTAHQQVAKVRKAENIVWGPPSPP
jgi:hypothetical protein